MVFHADEKTEIGLCQGVSLMNEGWILQVEDDENDVILLRHAFAEAGVYNHVHVVPNGQKAIDYLAGIGIYSDREKFSHAAIGLVGRKTAGHQRVGSSPMGPSAAGTGLVNSARVQFLAGARGHQDRL